jgi:ABC-type phosphate transport system substrate-binding protein
MPMPRGLLHLLTVVMFVLGLSSASIAGEERFKIIVHPDNPSDTVSRDFLRDAYLKKATEWHGETLRPIDLSSKHAVRDHFIKEVIRKSASQLRTYWNQQVFSGKGVPPPEVASVADVVAYVVSHPGAVGYVPADAAVGTAKVISIR